MITLETDFDAPVEQVWRALTEPAALAEWLMPVENFAAEVGRSFRVRAKPMPGWDGVVNCVVLAVDEPRKLRYSWQGSKMRRNTTVTWTLTPTESGTRLRLEHDGFGGVAGPLMAFMHRGGWKRMVTVALAGHLGAHAAT